MRNYRDPEAAGETGAATVQDSAMELFQTAAMLLGEEQEAVSVVEEVVAAAKSDPCADPEASHREAREQVIAASLKRLASHPMGGLDAGTAVDEISPGLCVESDDLSAAGLSPKQLEGMIEGPGSGRLRGWLDQLSPALRAVFVLRAILGQGNLAVSKALRESGSSGAEGWTPAKVSLVFRQALCSLANSLVHAGAAEVPVGNPVQN
jgi:hypothetical protein